ncbi:hypothetical protein D5086_011072 [Populus alba]|uniref:Uncharacterized protein n=1 Tax=Populus alba TaxID=43335 RepID=A0ACC4CB54_POPAL
MGKRRKIWSDYKGRGTWLMVGEFVGDANMEKGEREREDLLVGSRLRSSGLFMVKGMGDLVRESKMCYCGLEREMHKGVEVRKGLCKMGGTVVSIFL